MAGAHQPDRLLRSPEFGPRLLFFSGGTALKGVAHALTAYTHNAVHVITTFDSGGSSAVLRQAFDMPAVGDIRFRIMALADQSVPGNQESCRFFSHRLSQEASQAALLEDLRSLAEGEHALLRDLNPDVAGIFSEQLSYFRQIMPPDFDLRGAALGNLLLAAGYLRNNRRLDTSTFLFSRLLDAKGLVRPVLSQPAHLAVRLESGEYVVGQHRFTGKTAGLGLESPIADIWLADSPDFGRPVSLSISPSLAELIRTADLICYPLGSFYSSVLCNLLPGGVGRSVAANGGPKVYLPNPGQDPEQLGLDLAGQIRRLGQTLLCGGPSGTPVSAVLSGILVDSRSGRYQGGIPHDLLAELGLKLYDCQLITAGDVAGREGDSSCPQVDPDLVCRALLDIAAGRL